MGSGRVVWGSDRGLAVKGLGGPLCLRAQGSGPEPELLEGKGRRPRRCHTLCARDRPGASPTPPTFSAGLW